MAEPTFPESPADPSGEVTRLLVDWRGGDAGALDRLMPLVYDELRRVAQKRLSPDDGSTLQATALVNEAYLRLVDMEVEWRDRAHFFAIAAGLMRRILVDRARRRRAQKRGGDERPVAFEDAAAPGQPVDDLLALDEALRSLEKVDARKSRALELTYFGGLNADETAAVLEVSRATVERDLKTAKAWVLKEMSAPRGGGPGP